MFGSIDGSGNQTPHQQLVNYTSNCSQTNFITSLFTDFETTDYYNLNFDSNNFDSSEASSPPPTPDIISSFVGFPPESPVCETPPTYQNLCSPHYPIQSPTSSCSSMSMASPPITYHETRKKLIKDSLRLTIQSRRVAQGLDQIGSNDLSSNGNTESDTSPETPLTQADTERRRRRRERNKVAATKCRNKKKLHSVQLVQESESLQVNNAQMRKEISELQKECQQLMNLLNSHESICKHTINLNNYTTFTNYDENNNNNNINYYNNLNMHSI